MQHPLTVANNILAAAGPSSLTVPAANMRQTALFFFGLDIRRKDRNGFS